jgi:hypothetical protein
MIRNELDRENVAALTEAERKLLGTLVFWGQYGTAAMFSGAQLWSAVMGPRPTGTVTS